MTHPVSRFCLVIVLLVSLVCKASALTVFDPGNYAQNLLIATRQLQEIEQRVQQLANEAQMLLNMERNLASLGTSIAGPLQTRLTELRTLLGQAKGLAQGVEQAHVQYEQLFPGEDSKTLTMDHMVRLAQARWQERFEAFRTAFGVQAKIIENVREDSRHLSDLLKKSGEAVGAKSAIQAGNELMGLNIKQLMQLQTLLAAEARARTLEQAERTAAQSEARIWFKKFLGKKGR